MAKRPKILAAAHSPEFLELLKTLLDEAGYQTATALMGSAVMAEVKRFAPDAILVELITGHSDDLALLDQLRSEPTTRAVPVMALGALPQDLEEAVASYNVKQMMLLPFDVADLEQKVRATLEQAPLISLVGPSAALKLLFGEIATALAARSREIMIRWVQRITRIEPYPRLKLDLVAAIDHVPLLVEAVAMALQVPDYRGVFEQYPEIKKRVANHARTRIKQGVPLNAVVVEYQILREEIRRVIAEILESKGATIADTVEVVARKDFALDAILRITAEIYEQEMAGR